MQHGLLGSGVVLGHVVVQGPTGAFATNVMNSFISGILSESVGSFS